MSFTSTFTLLVETALDGFRRRVARRTIEGLPPRLRKDIGWPDPLPRCHPRRLPPPPGGRMP